MEPTSSDGRRHPFDGLDALGEREESDHVPSDRRIFVKQDGAPVKFYFYRLTPGQMDALRKLIEDHGGVICDIESNADTIITPFEWVDMMRAKYRFSKTTHAEDIPFIRKCIRMGKYQNTPPKILGMPGRPGMDGRFREQFTAADEVFLVKFLARVCPYADEGGRSGNEIYKALKTSEDPEWEYAKDRHTWQSWRDHYVKNKTRFDALIEERLKVDPPDPSGKGQYERKRRPRRGVEHSVHEVSDEEQDDYEEIDLELRSANQQLYSIAQEEEEEEEEPSMRDDRDRTPSDAPWDPSQSERRYDTPRRPVSQSPADPLDPYADIEFDFAPRNDDIQFPVAGPSGTHIAHHGKSKPDARRFTLPHVQMTSHQATRDALPMSSQATLVGTQGRGINILPNAGTAQGFTEGSSTTNVLVPPVPSPAAARGRVQGDSAQRKAARKVIKRRRINVVDLPSTSQPLEVARSRSQSAEPGPSSAQAGANDQGDQGPDEDDGSQSADEADRVPAGQSNDDAETADVEALLGEIVGSNIAPVISRNSISSDDQRSRRKLLPTQAVPSEIAASATKRSRVEQLSSSDEDDDEDDDEHDFSSRLIVPGPSISASRGHGTSRPSTSSVVRSSRPSAVQPLFSTPILQPDTSRRQSGPISATYDEESVPVAGTRAMAEKQKQLEAQLSPYTPPLGTRAAQTLRSTKRQLRPRPVPASKLRG